VQKKTDTLEIGSKAPQFTLAAANPQGNFSLRDLIARGPLVVESCVGPGDPTAASEWLSWSHTSRNLKS
jgi:hypothetical protein